MTVNEELLDSFLAGERPVYTLYEPQEVTIVLGAGRGAEEDVDLRQALADGVPILKRKGGGGTVVLSPGQIVLALVTRVLRPFANREYFQALGGWFKEALRALGVEGLEERGISDLAIGERKVLGSSLYRSRLLLFYQASLLVCNDLSLFSLYLSPPRRAPEYRAGREHQSFCTTLAREGYSLTPRQVAASLQRVVARNLPGLV